MRAAILSSAIIAIALGSLVAAQPRPVHVSFDGGRVTIVATDALLADVLAEWSRVGGALIIGADRLPPVRASVNFTGVDEQTAINAIIGSAAGFVVAARDPSSAGVSMFARLVIVSGSVPAAAPTPTHDVDTNLPEARFSYAPPVVVENADAPPMPSSEAQRAARERPAPAAASAPQTIPEALFHYTDPIVPSVPESDDGKPKEPAKKKQQ
jgi:hypothetical protein